MSRHTKIKRVTLFSAADYQALHAIVFHTDSAGRPTYPGYRPAVVESPNGDGNQDRGKRYAHVALKYVDQYTHGWKRSMLLAYLHVAHNRALDVARALGVPAEYMPSLEAGALRVLEYPPGTGSHVHTDMDLFTINLWRNMPTQVNCAERPEHVPLDVHLGELAELIGMGPATAHEVAPCHRAQQSLVYFAIPDHDAVLVEVLVDEFGVCRGTVGAWLRERLARSRYEGR